MKNTETGKTGENIAHKYLIKNLYLILARNHRERFDEIDIIARHQDGRLVFCEVKTLNASERFLGGFMPEDNFSEDKRRKIVRASEVFLARNPGLIIESRGWQIDLIAIILDGGRFSKLRHYENI